MADVHRIMTAALDDLDPSEVPEGLSGEVVKLTARGIVLAAQVCLLELTKGKRVADDVANCLELLATHLRSAPGSGSMRQAFLQSFPTAIDLSHARGTQRVAVLACRCAVSEHQGDGRSACEAAETAARLTTRALRKNPAALRAYLMKLRQQLVAGEAPPAEPSPSSAEGALTQLAADPTNDELRQVLGDQLAQQNDPLGTFIALQYQVAAGLGTAETTKQIDALLEQYRVQWLGPLATAVSEVVFSRGFVDEVVIANVSNAALAAIVGAPHWCTVRRIRVLSKLGEPPALKPMPALLKVLQQAALRSLVSLQGINSLVFEVLSGLPAARRLESVAIEVRAPFAEPFQALLARFPSLQVLGVNQIGAPFDLWEGVDLERFELVEVAGTTLDEVLRLSQRAKRIHFRANLRGAGTLVPNFLITRDQTGRRAWLNLGMTWVPRAEMLQFLQRVDWSDWAELTVYAKATFGTEAQQLETLTRQWPGRVTVTNSAVKAPQVPSVLRENAFTWSESTRVKAIAPSQRKPT